MRDSSQKSVLFITPSYFPNIGGVERHVEEVTKVLSKKIRVNILTITKDVNIYQTTRNEIHVKRIQIKKKKFINILYLPFWSYKNLKYFLNHDIIHVHDFLMFYYLVLPILPILYLKSKKIHITYHGWEGVYPPKRKVILLRWISELLTKRSIVIGDFIPKWYKMIKSPVVNYGGTSFEKKSSTKKDHNLFLFVGRLEADSGILFALDHFTSLSKSNDKFRLVVLGDGSLKYLKKGGYKNIEFRGMVDKNEVEDYMNKAKYCYTSGYLGIIEAYFSKCIIIASFDNQLKKDYLELFKEKYKLPLLIEDETNLNYSIPNNFTHSSVEADKHLTWGYVAEKYIELWNLNKN